MRRTTLAQVLDEDVLRIDITFITFLTDLEDLNTQSSRQVQMLDAVRQCPTAASDCRHSLTVIYCCPCVDAGDEERLAVPAEAAATASLTHCP